MNGLRTPGCITLAWMAGIIFCTANLAYPTGAPEEHTGGAGENDCSTCHFDELSGTPPQLRLQGLEDVVKAGTSHVITLTLTHPDMVVGGIQASIRAAADEQVDIGGLQAEGLKAFVKNGITYLNHPAPLQPESGNVTVELEWDVPVTAGTAVLNAAMVAGNNDNSPFGDSVVKVERVIKILPE